MGGEEVVVVMVRVMVQVEAGAKQIVQLLTTHNSSQQQRRQQSNLLSPVGLRRARDLVYDDLTDAVEQNLVAIDSVYWVGDGRVRVCVCVTKRYVLAAKSIEKSSIRVESE
jgi:hypothetical protein